MRPPAIAVREDEPGARVQQRGEVRGRRPGRHVVLADPDDIGPPHQTPGRRRPALDARAGPERAQQALPPQRDERIRGDRVGPGVVELPRDGRQDPGRRGPPGERHGDVGQREPRLEAGLDPAARRLDVPEDRAQRQPDAKQGHAGGREQLELVRLVCLRVEADHRGRPNPQARAGQRRVRHAAAQAPAARVVGGDVAAPGAGDHDLGLVRTRVAGAVVGIRPAGHAGPVTWRRGSRGRRRPGRGTSCPRTAACRGGAPPPWSRAPRGPRTGRSRRG